MSQQSLAREYAQALHRFAGDQYDAMSACIEAVEGAQERSKQFRDFLHHPSISVDEKMAQVAKLVAGPINPILRHVIAGLIVRRRLAVLPVIGTELAKLHLKATGAVDVVVSSAFPVTESQKRVIVDKLTEFTGKKVVARVEVDKELIGGFKLKIGPVSLDNTVKTDLDSISSRLIYSTSR